MIKLSPGNNHLVNILGSIDDKIENNENLSKQLFDIADKFICKKYKSNQYFTDKLINNICLLRDGTHNPPKRVEKGVALLTGQNIVDGFISYDKITYVSNDDYLKIHNKYEPQLNDIVITKIGTLGKVAILRQQDLPLTIHCNSALLRFNKINPNIAFFMLINDSFQNEYHKHKNRTVQEFINLQQISELNIKIPEFNSNEIINLEYILNKISHINNINKKLNELKQLYLKKFFG